MEIGRTEARRARGAVLATGPSIDAAAAWGEQLVATSEAGRARRLQRDGPGHHITLASKDELACLGETFLEDAAAMCAASVFVPLGAGTARSEGCTCHFVVLLWPAAQALRLRWELVPTDLHITLAFQPHDLHGIRKGPATLLPLPAVNTSAALMPFRTDWPAMCRALEHAAITPTLSLQELLLASARLLELASDVDQSVTWSELHCTRALILGRNGRHGEAMEEAERARAVATSAKEQARPQLLCSAAACSLHQWDKARELAAGVSLQHLDAPDVHRAARVQALCERMLPVPGNRGAG